MKSTKTSCKNKIPVAIVFLGPPASGKGTAAAYFQKEFNYQSVSPGAIFKKLREEDSETAQLVRETVKDGGLCPDWLTDKLVLEEATKLIKNGAKSITLDGYPRTVEQLDFLMENYDVKLFVHSNTHWMTMKKMVVNRRNCKQCKALFSALEPIKCCSKKECGIDDQSNWEIRWDDTAEFFSKRYNVYKKETLPVIDKVKNFNNYVKLDLIKDNLAYSKIIKLI
jgi:adenylate kinase